MRKQSRRNIVVVFLLVVGVSSAAVGAAHLTMQGVSNGRYTDNEIRIGIITDMKGKHSDLAGQGAEVAARMATEDIGGEVNGKPIRFFIVDHKNDPQMAEEAARRLYADEGVDAFAELVGTGPWP